MKVGFIGVGAMGSMLIASHYRFSKDAEIQLFASDAVPERAVKVQSAHPALRICSNQPLASSCDVVFVCVPPHSYLVVARGIAPAVTPDKLVVCISSGVDLDVLGRTVTARIVKMIPNVAHAAGRGVALLMKGPRATDDDVRFLQRFLKPMSMPMLVDAENSRIATNITSCGPAILAAFCNLFIDASTEFAQGIDREVLAGMMRETFLATAGLCEQGASFDSIVADVSTPGGTTEIAVRTLAEKLPATLALLIQRTMERERALKSSGGNKDVAIP